MATKVMSDVAMGAAIAYFLYTDEVVIMSWSSKGSSATLEAFTEGAMGDWYRYLMYEMEAESDEEDADEVSQWMAVIDPSPSQDSD